MRHTVDYIKKNPWLFILMIPAFLIYMLVILPSGSHYCYKGECGIYFWGVHGHDAIWHLAIAETSFNKFPFVAPTFAGAKLTGYNFLMDYVIFLLSKLGIPTIITYFKIFPILWFILFTWLLIVLARKIIDKPLFVGLMLFFSYFTGSFSYFLTLYHHKTIWGSAYLLSNLTIHSMSNLQFAFSLPIILGILILIKNKRIDVKTVIIMGILNFLNLGLKFYGGVVSSFLIFIYIFLTYFPKNIKKLIIYEIISLIFILLSIFAFYNPLSSIKSGAVFSFAPFALIHTITEEPNLFYLQSWTDARYFLQSTGIIGPRLVWIESINLLLFLIFYLGVRFFGLIYVFFKLLLKKKRDTFDVSLFATIIFATILMILLVQKAEWWNTIQFFYYAIFLATIYLAELAYKMAISKNLLLKIGLIIIILLAIPANFDIVRGYATFPGVSYVSDEELKALNFLKKLPEGVVFTPLYDKSLKDYSKANQMYRYEDTAYVSAFTGKQVYLSDILQLRLTGVDYEKRLKKVEKLDCGILDEVDYIYDIRHLKNERKMVECPDKKDKVKQLMINNDVSFVYSIIK